MGVRDERHRLTSQCKGEFLIVLCRKRQLGAPLGHLLLCGVIRCPIGRETALRLAAWVEAARVAGWRAWPLCPHTALGKWLGASSWTILFPSSFDSSLLPDEPSCQLPASSPPIQHADSNPVLRTILILYFTFSGQRLKPI